MVFGHFSWIFLLQNRGTKDAAPRGLPPGARRGAVQRGQLGSEDVQDGAWKGVSVFLKLFFCSEKRCSVQKKKV